MAVASFARCAESCTYGMARWSLEVVPCRLINCRSWSMSDRNPQLIRAGTPPAGTPPAGAPCSSRRHVGEAAVLTLECGRHRAGAAVAVLGDDQVGFAGALGLRLVQIRPVDEQHQVGVL